MTIENDLPGHSDLEETPHLVAIVILSNEMMYADFAMSLMGMLGYSAQEGVRTLVVNSRERDTCKARNDALKQVFNLRMPFTHVLFLDADMTFPEDALVRLLACDHSVIGAAHVINEGGGKFSCKGFDDEHYDIRQHDGILKVKSNEFSLTLVKAELFTQSQSPWFNSWEGADGIRISDCDDFCYSFGPTDGIHVECKLSGRVGKISGHIFKASDVKDPAESSLIHLVN